LYRQCYHVSLIQPIYLLKILLPDVHRAFLERFEYYESLAMKDKLCLREHYFIGHYDKTKRWKRRWCSINSECLLSVKGVVTNGIIKGKISMLQHVHIAGHTLP